MSDTTRLTEAEKNAIENAWCASRQDGPAGDDDPMYRCVASIKAQAWRDGQAEAWDEGYRASAGDHTLKTLPGYFDAVKSGAKTFEIRRNDRGFQTGDLIELVRMHDSLDSTAYAGGRETLRKRITYVFSGDPALGPQLGGIAPGYVVLGLGDDATTEGGEPDAD